MINSDRAQPLILEKDEIPAHSTHIDESKLEVQPDDDHFKESNIHIGSENPKVSRKVRRLIRKYRNIFREYCVAGEQAKVTPEVLPLKPDATPQICPIFAKRPEIHQEVEQFAAKLAERGLTKEQRSNWRANIVLLKKKDATKRFAIDYRRLNEQSAIDPIPCL